MPKEEVTNMKLKFNLNFGSEQVRTIEDVRTQATNAREILSEIIKTFQEKEETDPAYVEVDFSVFDYFDGGNKFRADFRSGQLYEKLDTVLEQGSAKVIQEYHRGYDALVQDILDHSDDLTYIYDRLDDLTAGYSTLIKASSTDLFERFRYKAPLAALALYGHHGTRPCKGKHLRDFVIQRDCSSTCTIRKSLSKYVKLFQYEKEYKTWHNVEPAGKKYLIICGHFHSSSHKHELVIASPNDHADL